MLIHLKARFDAVASNWADAIAAEMTAIPAEAIREAVDKDTVPRIVWEVCQACAREGVSKPEQQEKYAASAVKAFDKRLDKLIAQRNGATVH